MFVIIMLDCAHMRYWPFPCSSFSISMVKLYQERSFRKFWLKKKTKSLRYLHCNFWHISSSMKSWLNILHWTSELKDHIWLQSAYHVYYTMIKEITSALSFGIFLLPFLNRKVSPVCWILKGANEKVILASKNTDHEI